MENFSRMTEALKEMDTPIKSLNGNNSKFDPGSAVFSVNTTVHTGGLNEIIAKRNDSLVGEREKTKVFCIINPWK